MKMKMKIRNKMKINQVYCLQMQAPLSKMNTAKRKGHRKTIKMEGNNFCKKYIYIKYKYLVYNSK